MSTGCSWEGIRQVRATLLDARHVPERLCGGRVYLGHYIKCSTFTFTFTFYSDPLSSRLRQNGPRPLTPRVGGSPPDTSHATRNVVLRGGDLYKWGKRQAFFVQNAVK